MSETRDDPYAILGVTPEVSDAQLRRAYRALVKRDHPDHNGGSRESSARFAALQDAYVRVLKARRAQAVERTPPPAPDAALEQRLAALEREVAAARAMQRRAQHDEQRPASAWAADVAAAWSGTHAPSREQLGYYDTDDTFAKILDDAGSELGRRLQGTGRKPERRQFRRRLTDLFADGERDRRE